MVPEDAFAKGVVVCEGRVLEERATVDACELFTVVVKGSKNLY